MFEDEEFVVEEQNGCDEEFLSVTGLGDYDDARVLHRASLMMVYCGFNQFLAGDITRSQFHAVMDLALEHYTSEMDLRETLGC